MLQISKKKKGINHNLVAIPNNSHFRKMKKKTKVFQCIAALKVNVFIITSGRLTFSIPIVEAVSTFPYYRWPQWAPPTTICASLFPTEQIG